MWKHHLQETNPGYELKPEYMVTSSQSELANRKPSSCILLLLIALIVSFQTRNDLAFVHALIIGIKTDKGRTLTSDGSSSLETIFSRNSKGARRDKKNKESWWGPSWAPIRAACWCRLPKPPYATQRLFTCIVPTNMKTITYVYASVAFDKFKKVSTLLYVAPSSCADGRS